MKVARYIRRGHGISHRARIAKENNVHPMTHWIKQLAVDKETLKKLLIYAGDHQTGLYGMRTAFYRMPDMNKPEEADRFIQVYKHADPAKKKFLHYLERYREKSEEKKVISISQFLDEVDKTGKRRTI